MCILPEQTETVYEIFKVNGDSMFPTLQSGYHVMVQKQEVYYVGDIVVFKPPFNAKFAVKRISNKKGKSYFMLSDNKDLPNVYDSRQYGFINQNQIIGKVIKIYDH